jgi:DNA-binding CsgD family transcriptional regulator
MVSPDPRIEVGVSIQRRIGKHDYVESDFDVLSRLGLHIERSLRLGIRLMDAELSKMGLGNALARVGIGVFVLDSLGRIVFSNPASESLLGDGLAVVDNRLIVTPTASNAQAFDTLKRLGDVNQGDMAEQRPIRIHRRSSGRPLTLYVIPIPMAATAVNRFLTHARVIVLVIDPDNDSPPEPSLVRDILGLTLGEARVAALVGAGLSTGQAAQRLGIADETARSVLKRVFAKVGVSRQSELAAMMTRLILK